MNMISANDNDLSRPAYVGKMLAGLAALTAAPAIAPTAFAVGGTYATASICDSNCWFSITIAKRTAKTITTTKGKLLRIYLYDGIEHVRPNGNYSMAASIGADDLNRGPRK